jgi:hypothetical protein
VGTNETRLLRRCQLQLDLSSHLLSHIPLESHGLALVALIAARPEVRLIADLNEFSSDAHDTALSVDGALQQIVHSQFAANLRHGQRRVFVVHRRGTSDDGQPWRAQVSQSSDHFFGQAITEILLVGVTA